MRLYLVYFISLVGLFGLTSGGFFENIWLGVEEDPIVKGRDDTHDNNITTCECASLVCKCCTDLELAYVDLGGPGCVELQYLQQDELLVNVSYGNSRIVHSKKVKGPNPEPTCTPNKVAQLCATFSKFEPSESGQVGCLVLEPKLFGAVTSHLKMGCFSMSPSEMRLVERNITVVQEDLNGQNQTDTDIFSEDLLAVVNETAQQGLAFLGNLLGLTFGGTPAENGENSTVANVTSSSIAETANQ